MPFSFNLSSGNYLSTQDVEVLQRATALLNKSDFG